jgi:hypothetical protein
MAVVAVVASRAAPAACTVAPAPGGLIELVRGAILNHLMIDPFGAVSGGRRKDG